MNSVEEVLLKHFPEGIQGVTYSKCNNLTEIPRNIRNELIRRKKKYIKENKTKKLTILTEEAPDINEINFLLNCYEDEYEKNSNSNNNLKLDITDKKITGKWNVISSKYDITIKLMKGNSACVDYLLFEGDLDEKFNVNDAKVVLESTKTCPTSSRNTNVYQRLTKFIHWKKMFPKSGAKLIMYYNQPWGDNKLPATSLYGLRCMKTMGINAYYIHNESYVNIFTKYNIKDFQNDNEVIKGKNEMKEKRGNISVKVKKEGNKYMIQGKLEKQNTISHDPNIGLISSLINIIKKFNDDATFVLERHGIGQSYLDKCPNNKFFHSIKDINVTFEGIKIIKLPELPKDYCTIESAMTEKLSTISYSELNTDEVIFSNHGGCALTNISQKGIEICKVGQKEHRPDIVFCNDVKKEITIVEGKVEKDLSKGINQLSDEYLKCFIDKIKIDRSEYTIIKGLCITIDDIVNLHKYKNLKFPILFALDQYGNYHIN